MHIALSVAAVLLLLVVIFWWRRRRASAASGDDLFISEGGEALLGPETDWSFLDEYLTRWDRFARGENDLVPLLRRDVARFNAELARALDREPGRAITPAIMYPLLQIGGFVPLDSAVGQAMTRVFGAQAPPVTSMNDKSYYFAGVLYFWLERHAGELPPYPLYADWHQRDMTREKVIPMYTGVVERAKSKAPAPPG